MAVGIAKLEFYNHLRQVPGVAADGVTPLYPAGYVHLPMVDPEFVQQLCAEQLVTRRDRHGFAVREWQKTQERNDSLDCRNYARAAAAAAGLDRFEERHWRELERQLRLERPPDAPPPMPAINVNEATPSGGLAVSAACNAGRRLVRSGWMTRGRAGR